MSISNYAEAAILNAVGNNTAFQVAQCYLKLHIGNPGEDGTGSPAVETTRKSASFASASGGSMASDADMTWTSVAASETYTYFSLWDASSNGNCIWTGTITANAVTAGDTFTIPSGSLTLTLD